MPVPLAPEVRAQVDQLSARLRHSASGRTVDWGCVLGSGLRDALGAFQVLETLSLPSFGSAVPGHVPEVHLAESHGRLLAVCTGRHHVYECLPLSYVAFHVSLLHALGVRHLALCNAAGSLDPGLPPGSLMLIRDHIDTTFHAYSAQLVRRASGAPGARPAVFYPARLRQAAAVAGESLTCAAKEGVYAFVSGPFYETRTEIHALGILGAQAVGMSTVLEAVYATALQMTVLGVSVITNMATGLAETEHSHDSVVDAAARAAGDLGRLLEGVMARMADGGAVTEQSDCEGPDAVL